MNRPWLAALPTLAIATLSCSAPVTPAPGQLMVVLGSDMTPGRDFTELRMTVEDPRVSGVLENSWTFRTLANGRFGGDTALPATVAVVGVPGSRGVVTTVRVEAKLEGAVRVARVARVVIPESGVQTLRMTTDWLCWDKLPVDEVDGAPVSCPAGRACVAGACVKPEDSQKELVPFDEASVFGGTADSRTCFDVLRCFAGGTVVRPALTNPETCAFVYGGNAGNVSVAVRMPSAVTRGYCARDGCLLPLDRGTAGGFVVAEGNAIVLPLAVCTHARGLEVVTSERCGPKVQAVPACGEWSSSAGDHDGNDPNFVLDLREAAAR